MFENLFALFDDFALTIFKLLWKIRPELGFMQAFTSTLRSVGALTFDPSCDSPDFQVWFFADENKGRALGRGVRAVPKPVGTCSPARGTCLVSKGQREGTDIELHPAVCHKNCVHLGGTQFALFTEDFLCHFSRVFLWRSRKSNPTP